MGFNAHVENIHQIHFHRMQAGIHWSTEVSVSKNVKRITESAKTGFSKDVVWFKVFIVVWDTGNFGVMTREADLNLTASGYYFIGVLKRIDLIFEDQKISGFLVVVEEDSVQMCFKRTCKTEQRDTCQ